MKPINLLLFPVLFSDQVQGFIEAIEVNVPTGWNVTFILTEDEHHKASSSFSLFVNSSTIVTVYPDGKPPNVTKNYTARVDVSSAKSVTLMNLQKSDSGRYCAEVTEQTEPFKQYNVTVQDGVNFTDSMCNTTTHEGRVTCSTEDYIITGTLIPPNKTQAQPPSMPEWSPTKRDVIIDVAVGGVAVVVAVGAVVVLYFILKNYKL